MLSDGQNNKVPDKVNRIYQNYGIDVSDMSEEDLAVVYNWYRINLDALDKDLDKSEKHKLENGNKDE